MKIEELNAMSDEELYDLSLEKNNKGCATNDAYMAQRIIWARSGLSFQSDERTIDLGFGNRTTKRYEGDVI